MSERTLVELCNDSFVSFLFFFSDRHGLKNHRALAFYLASCVSVGGRPAGGERSGKRGEGRRVLEMPLAFPMPSSPLLACRSCGLFCICFGGKSARCCRHGGKKRCVPWVAVLSVRAAPLLEVLPGPPRSSERTRGHSRHASDAHTTCPTCRLRRLPARLPSSHLQTPNGFLDFFFCFLVLCYFVAKALPVRLINETGKDVKRTLGWFIGFGLSGFPSTTPAATWSLAVFGVDKKECWFLSCIMLVKKLQIPQNS